MWNRDIAKDRVGAESCNRLKQLTHGLLVLGTCLALFVGVMGIAPALAALADDQEVELTSFSLNGEFYDAETLQSTYIDLNESGGLSLEMTIKDNKADRDLAADPVLVTLTVGSGEVTQYSSAEDAENKLVPIEGEDHDGEYTFSQQYGTLDEGAQSIKLSYDGTDPAASLFDSFINVDNTKPVAEPEMDREPDSVRGRSGNKRYIYMGGVDLIFNITEANIDTIEVSAIVGNRESKWVMGPAATNHTFTGPGNYSNVKVTVKDKAGHEETFEPEYKTFTIKSNTGLKSEFSIEDTSDKPATTYTLGQLTDDEVDYLGTNNPTFNFVVDFGDIKTEATTIEVLDSTGVTTTYAGDGITWQHEDGDDLWSTDSIIIPNDGPTAVTIKAVYSYRSGSAAEIIKFGWTEGDGTTEPTTNGKFIIDVTAPVVGEIKWDNTDASNKKYYKADRTATVTIKEVNFDTENADEWIRYNERSDKAKSLKWKHDDQGNHTATLVFDEDGEYSFEVQGSDLAGNGSNKVESGDFVIDKTVPVIGEFVWDKNFEVYEGKKFFREKPTVKITVTEHNFNSELFNISTTGDNEYVEMGEWESDGDDHHTISVTFTKEIAYNITVTGKDLADNEAKPMTQDLVIDLTAPQVTDVKVNNTPAKMTEDEAYFFYNSDATMTINVSDGNAIARASYTFPSLNITTDANHLIDGDDTYTAQMSVKGNTATIDIALQEGRGSEEHKLKEFERNVILTVWDIAGNMRTWSISPKGAVSDANGSSVVNASINGKGVYPTNLVVDKTSPQIDVTGVTAGTFYNSDQTATLDVNEYNFSYLQLFDGSRVIMTVTKAEGNAGRAVSVEEIVAKDLRGNDPSYIYAYDCNSDGHYVIDASFLDYANNQSNVIHIDEFTIDKTDPIIEVEWDNNTVFNGKYYNAGRIATITVTEHNFDESLFTVETTGVMSGWSHDGDTHTMTVSCTDDGGVYFLRVNGADQAGNQAVEYVEDEFVVDMSKPEIAFSGDFGDHTLEKAESREGELVVSDATNGVVAPVITYTDKPDVNGGEPYDDGSVTYELTRLDGESAGLVDNPVPDEGVSGGVYHVTFNDFGLLSNTNDQGMNYELEADGVYKLTAHVTDFASNEADNEIVFSVNRYGSTFVVESVYTYGEVQKEHRDEAQKSVVWLGEEPSILVRSIDVSSNTDHYVTVERPDAQAPTLNEIDGRTVANTARNNFEGYVYSVANDGSKGWYEYTYRIGTKNFGKGHGGEGAYTLTVSTSDEAGNTSTAERFYNRQKEGALASAQVSFFLDSIGPEVQIIEPSAIEIGSSYDLQFQVIDEQKLSNEKIALKIDGINLDDAAMRALKEEGALNGPDSVGNYTLKMDHKTILDARNVEIVATDWIDRSASASTGAFRITNLVAEILAATALIGGTTAGLVYTRSKKNQQSSSDSPYSY